MLANYQDAVIFKRGIPVTLKPGQVGWSEESLAERWKWSRGRVRRFLKWLEQNSVQQIERQSDNVTTVISLTNWQKYQGDSTTDGTPNGTADGHQTDTKRYRKKKVKKVKNDIPPLESPPKITHMDCVQLTEEEYQKLVQKMNGTQSVQEYIERLNDYIMSTGKKYKSHYHTILTWRRKDYPNEGRNKGNARNLFLYPDEEGDN